jgi:CRP/FNR family transcriptional regulator, cyclic AMP receptor protein
MKTIKNIITPTAGPASSTPAVESIIKEHPFLQGLSPHQQRLLADCAMHVRFKEGQLIFREGDPANRFYLIQKGKVALESMVKDCGTRVILELGPGEVLGWSWLFPPYYWHFDARVVEPTEALFFYGTPLRDECESDHELGYELMKRCAAVMMGRLQAVRRQLLDLRGFPEEGNARRQ